MESQTREKWRINKYLSMSGYCSRREADRLISEGKVLINGQPAVLGSMVGEEDILTVDGRTVSMNARRIGLLFYKPAGIVCSTVSQRGETNVIDYIGFPQRVFPVGRLDKDSEGLLLLTNQGDLANEILKASNYHEKEYIVDINAPVTEEFLQKMAGGIPILNTVTRPCPVWKTGERTFHIILTQGLNRQIRRMCEACGCHVKRLKRIRILNLTIDGLSPGKYREMTEKEWKILLETFHNKNTDNKKGIHDGRKKEENS